MSFLLEKTFWYRAEAILDTLEGQMLQGTITQELFKYNNC